MLNKIISKRKFIQGIFGVVLFSAATYFHINLIYVLLFGALLGVILGKVFCRWMCPVGFLMEIMMSGDSNNQRQQLYMYHKLGCPIAWVSGFLNRFSLFKIKREAASCTSCGECDKACYISTLNKDYSLYKKNKQNPSSSYSCSKCLECLKACPSKSLSYKLL